MDHTSDSSSTSGDSTPSEVFSVLGDTKCTCTSIPSSSSGSDSEFSYLSDSSNDSVHGSPSESASVYSITSESAVSDGKSDNSESTCVDSETSPVPGCSGISRGTKRSHVPDESSNDSVLSSGTIASVNTRRKTPNPIKEDFSLWKKADPLEHLMRSNHAHSEAQPDYFPLSELSTDDSDSGTVPLSDRGSLGSPQPSTSRDCKTPEIYVSNPRSITNPATDCDADRDGDTDIISEGEIGPLLPPSDEYGYSTSTEPYIGSIPQGRRQLRYRMCDTGYRNCCRPVLLTRVSHWNQLLRRNGENANDEYNMYYPGQISHMVTKVENKRKAAKRANTQGDSKLDSLPTVLLMSGTCRRRGCEYEDNYSSDITATTIFNPVCCPLSGVLAHPCISSGLTST